MDGPQVPNRLSFSWSPLDRSEGRRRDEAFLKQARADSDALLLVVASGSRVAVGPAGGLAWRPLAGDRGAEDASFLGVAADGRALFSRDAADDEAVEADGNSTLASLRDVGADLSDLDAAAAVEAVGLSGWHRSAPHCPRCGAATVSEDAGHRRRCRECGTSQFPRSDPAVIMLVTAGDRCVLGQRAGNQATNRWSTLAGFVEVGESLESAVAREVFEESGLTVREARYRGSQPWPFPASLMLAFEADADYGPITVSDEHADVRWFTRQEVAAALADGTMAFPSTISAGGFLIRGWLAAAQ